jgi:hypothetical protein
MLRVPMWQLTILGRSQEKLAKVFGVNGSSEQSEPPVASPAPPTDAVPAVSLERAVTRDTVYCMCCGKGFKMLKRHIGAEHGLTEAGVSRKVWIAAGFSAGGAELFRDESGIRQEGRPWKVRAAARKPGGVKRTTFRWRLWSGSAAGLFLCLFIC